jgi:hypothetical protein
MAHQYYVREPGTEESKGPLDLDQITTLAEAGKISLSTEVFVDDQDTWLPIEQAPEIRALVFPEKRKLNLKAKDPAAANTLNAPPPAGSSIKVEDMLAAAEGDTEETRFLKEQQKSREKAIGLCMPMLGVLFLLFGAALVYPHYAFVRDTVMADSFDFAKLLSRPAIVVAAADLLIGLLLLLGASETLWLARLRAIAVPGWIAWLYFGQGIGATADGPVLIWAGAGAAVFGVGTLIASFSLNFKLVLGAGVLACGGMIAAVWPTLIQPLLG